MKTRIGVLSLGMLVTLLPMEMVSADDNKTLSYHLTSYFRASRAVVTKNKSLIVTPKGVLKGMTPAEYAEKFIGKTNKRYKRVTSDKFDTSDPVKAHLVESIRMTIEKAVKGQFDGDFLYSPDTYFKEGAKKYDGKFLPARFAVEVMNTFSARNNGKIVLKLTAPSALLVKKSNAPDDWENRVIETIFKRADYEKGTPFSEVVLVKGKKAFRQIIPEYYNKKCMGCHGGEANQDGINIHQKDVVGTKGQLGGAISVMIFE
ncbi:hypothetical protein A9Q84_02080 [Halobacteriovorax marinus]|uniref:Tll0287-like domain-containing protein n=1 Tax=Halobacteriovorax marinus TaxID=97084 RepID=A0A1Y5FCM5_9BACT|nr:hypothetical protein A9Q84_02080 [Halobacteriovorax marinus]